jgi:hypothetical protein
MLEQVSEMTSFNSQTCLILGEQMYQILFELTFYKLPILCGKSTAAARLAHRQYYRRAYRTLHHISHKVKTNLLSVNRRVNHSAT